jgi:signal transduction histidine kinase
LPRNLLLLLVLAARLAAAEPPLDTVAKVRALTPQDAARSLPVIFEATVIYFDPKTKDLFVCDTTASTYVSLGKHYVHPIPQLESGSRVRIDGTTHPGEFYPIVIPETIEVLGKSPLPPPRHIGEQELLAPALDSQWVEVAGVVTGVESAGLAFTLAVEVHGWKMKVEIPSNDQAAGRAAALMQRPVQLQGCVGTVFNTQRQMTGRFFYVPSFDQIIPTDTPDSSIKPPLRSVIQLLRSEESAQALVRIEGVVTQTEGNDFYLRDASGSMLVRTAGQQSLSVGTHVLAEGFAAMAPFRPILRARRVEVLGRTTLPPPRQLHFGLDQLPLFHAELVTLEGDFLNRRDGVVEIALQCRAGDRFFEAISPLGNALPAGLTAGDHLQLTGICELTTTHPTPRSEWVDGFRIHLPAAGGITILRRASWWTLRHSFIALGIVSAMALGSLAWVRLLRQQVKKQTKMIGIQLQRVAVRDERQRIARELHDTVEQGLTGLSMQLGNISGDIVAAPDLAQSAIQLAQQMLRHCREESRASIHDLRGIELEQRGLAGALERLLPPVAQETSAAFQVTITGHIRHLEATTENHLLRIAQECLTNAARHAAARSISVCLDYTPDAVTLTVRDDGRGFDTHTPAPQGHFGILGIRERANKIQAALTIASRLGEGTTIQVIAANAAATELPHE